MNQKYILLFLLLLCFYAPILTQYNQQILDDTVTCTEASDNECLSATNKLKTNVYQCCLTEHYKYVKEKGFEKTWKMCTLMDVATAKKIFESPITKAIQRESYGFSVYVFHAMSGEENLDDLTYLKIKDDYNCKDVKFSSVYGDEEYDENDIKILKSEDHCMRYFFNNIYSDDFMTKLPSENNCFNAQLLPSSKKAGVSCAHLSFSYKDNNGKDQIFSTCYIIDFTSGQFDDKSRSAFGSLCDMVEGYGTCIDYSVKAVDSAGNSITFNSKTGEITEQKLATTQVDSPKAGSEKLKVTLSFILFLSLILI